MDYQSIYTDAISNLNPLLKIKSKLIQDLESHLHIQTINFVS